LSTFVLLGIGGLVTSHGAGMAVPDWPTSYGYNMFFLPIRFWHGGVFYEHTHRLWASLTGVLVVGLTRWLGGAASRKPLAIVGGAELSAGFLLLWLDPKWSGAGHFLSGIGGVVLVASAIWARNEPSERPLPLLGWLAFGLVQLQGLLGGLRVVLFEDQLGIVHGTLAQLFFVLLCVIAVRTSRWRDLFRASADPAGLPRHPARWLFIGATALVFVQLVLGASMRHQHAGLAIPDFPLAYGKLWPATDPASIARYNEHRIEVLAANPITAFQIELQMAHRILAALILAAVLGCAGFAFRTLSWRHPVTRLSVVWLALLVAQAGLGAATILTNKAADVATAHVLAGALSLALGAVLSLLASGNQTESTAETRRRGERGRAEEGNSRIAFASSAPWRLRVKSPLVSARDS
jgi:cytochrome c oxidase assembly protein subunit 15